ncbi:Cof-type HAD-IIB family hydrolase [Enterococcus sp. LJL120]
MVDIKKVKAIIFDYDGTLKNYNEPRITKEIEETLREIRQQNIRVFLATGRPHNHCEYLLKEKLIDCLISANGALVKTETKTIFCEKMPPQILVDFFEFTRQKQIPATFYAEELFSNGIQNEDIQTGLKEAMALDANDLATFNLKQKEAIFLMCAFIKSNHDSQLKGNFQELVFSRWHPQIVSVLTKSVTKVTGIEQALNYYDILPSECIAVGDGGNDIEMLRYCGYGIAVGDKNSQLVSVADKVIAKVDRGMFSFIKNSD